MLRPRTRKIQRSPVSLTGQVALPPAFDKARAKIIEVKAKIKEKRPGLIIPAETSSLLSPRRISVAGERTIPRARAFRNIAVNF